MKKVIITILLTLLISLSGKLFAQEAEETKWKGMDEAVIEKIAIEYNREPKPIIELEGDLELSAFALFFGVAGFIAGYYWRKLLSERKSVSSSL